MAIAFYSNQTPPVTVPEPSVFLAGPTPRSREQVSWRPQALDKFDGLSGQLCVFVPEWDSGEPMADYDAQVAWEWRHLDRVSVILFWVPRELPHMPAFTTNVEFGHYLAKRPRNVIYGRPEGAVKNRYLDALYKQVTGMEPCITLEQACVCAFIRAKQVTPVGFAPYQLPQEDGHARRDSLDSGPGGDGPALCPVPGVPVSRPGRTAAAWFPRGGEGGGGRAARGMDRTPGADPHPGA
jgi:hypothetical protein